MIPSLQKDIQLLMKILQNQQNIKNVIRDFGCTEKDLETNTYAFDLCALYMAQIGEAAKLLTKETQDSFQYFDGTITKYFRNMIDHVYEKVNRKYLKAYIFTTVSNEVMKEIKDRIQYCHEHA